MSNKSLTKKIILQLKSMAKIEVLNEMIQEATKKGDIDLLQKLEDIREDSYFE